MAVVKKWRRFTLTLAKLSLVFQLGGGGHGSKVCPHLNQNCIVSSLFGHCKKEGGRVHPILTKLYGWGGHRKKVKVHPAPTKKLLFLDGGGHLEVVGGLPLPNSIVSLVG